MTPFGIAILLHINTSPSEPPQKGTLIYDDIIDSFCENGLVYLDGTRWKTTEKGDAHVKQLCELPFPEKKYVRFDGEIID